MHAGADQRNRLKMPFIEEKSGNNTPATTAATTPTTGEGAVMHYDADTKQMTPSSPSLLKRARSTATTASNKTSDDSAQHKKASLYDMLTDFSASAEAMRPAAPVDPYAWLQHGRTKRRRHSSPMLSAMAASYPGAEHSLGSSTLSSPQSTSSTLSSPASPMAMMSLASPTLPKMPLIPLPGRVVASDDGERVGSGRRLSSPMILPLDLKPEEIADDAWWAEMLRSRKSFLHDTTDVDWENITVIELKRILRKYGLHSVGKKTVLVERIQTAHQQLQAMSLERPKRTNTNISGPEGTNSRKANSSGKASFVGGKMDDLMAAVEAEAQPNL